MEVSGQQINFEKSSLQFGYKVPEPIKEEMKTILGITTMGGMGSYLGIPESLGGAKTQVFSFIQDRLHGRVNGWTTKYLSRGGKEVVIKSVATALPNHVMSCFRLPKTVTNKLTSVVSQFWWSSGGGNKGMHWIAWDKLCQDKDDGGIGFRAFADTNTAFLAKQLWRLIDKPELLFSKVFKGRYFRKTDPLDPIRSYSPSYGWRSIISARSLVKKGLIKRVGSGASISIWNDPWIPAYRPRPATRKPNSTIQVDTVDQLIDQQRRTWNKLLIEAVFEPDDATIIVSIPISKSLFPDRYGWHFTKSGRYSVKSGYHTEREFSDLGNHERILGPDIKRLQSHVWKLNCAPKLRHFVWQILSGCLAVSKNLRSRGIHCDTYCVRCGAEETINHVLFECPPALQTWALSRIPTNPICFPTDALFTNMDYLFWRLPPQEINCQFPWILWYIWKSRNDMIYNQIDRDPNETLRLAESEYLSWEGAQTSIIDNNQRHGGNDTKDATIAVQKGQWCFVDGAWKEGDQFTGQGWYSCYEGGINVQMGATTIRQSLSPLHAEFETLIWAMECMEFFNQGHITFATDCSDVVKIVSEPENWPAFTVYVEEYEKRKLSFTAFDLKHISRTQNQTADRLARSARLRQSSSTHIGPEPPIWMIEK